MTTIFILACAALVAYYFYNKHILNKNITGSDGLRFLENEVDEISRKWWMHCGCLDIIREPETVNKELNYFLGIYFNISGPTVGQPEKNTTESVKEYIRIKLQSSMRGDLENEEAAVRTEPSSIGDMSSSSNSKYQLNKAEIVLIESARKRVHSLAETIAESWEELFPQLGRLSDEAYFKQLNNYICIWFKWNDSCVIDGRAANLSDKAVLDYIKTVCGVALVEGDRWKWDAIKGERGRVLRQGDYLVALWFDKVRFLQSKNIKLTYNE